MRTIAIYTEIECDECGRVVAVQSRDTKSGTVSGTVKEFLDNEGWFSEGEADYCCIECYQSAMSLLPPPICDICGGTEYDCKCDEPSYYPERP